MQDDYSAQTKAFHDDVRQLVRMLLKLAEFDSDRKETRQLMLGMFHSILYDSMSAVSLAVLFHIC